MFFVKKFLLIFSVMHSATFVCVGLRSVEFIELRCMWWSCHGVLEK